MPSEKGIKNITIEETPMLHPKSRKCRAIEKKFKKDTKKEKSKQETKLKQSLVSEKLLWFQKNLDPEIFVYTVETAALLVEKYIARNDDELEQIKIKRSIGVNRNKQHIGREDAILMTKERERRDFETCGLEIPDILNKNQCSMLRKWNGDLKLLPNFKFCSFSKRRLENELKKNKSTVNKKEMKVIENIDQNSIDSRTADESKTLSHVVSTSNILSQPPSDKMDLED